MGILKDIQTGALPPEEIPGFVAWGLRKLFWPLIVVVVIGLPILLFAVR